MKDDEVKSQNSKVPAKGWSASGGKSESSAYAEASADMQNSKVGEETETEETAGLGQVANEPQDLVADYKAKWLRAVADYQNLKKESEKDRLEWVKFANAGLILELLPIVNHFKEAVKHVPEAEKTADWVVGIFHIKKQLEDLLKNLGIEEIKTVGEPFNPEYHEAVEHREVADTAADTVVEELRPGYTLHGKVIEPAKVVVSK